MGFDTKETLRIAERIYNNEGNESGFRSSTNRAYYGSFIECCKLAKRHSYTPGNQKLKNFGHKELSDCLAKHSFGSVTTQQDQEIRKVGRRLAQIRDLRAKADYQDVAIFKRNQAKDALEQAKVIIKLAAGL